MPPLVVSGARRTAPGRLQLFDVVGHGRGADLVRAMRSATAQFAVSLPDLAQNAGVFAFQPIEAVTEAEFHRQFNINVLGALLVAQQAAKHIGPAGGSIVNVSSVVSESPVPGSSIYAATKGALDTLSLQLSAELAPCKIRVNTVAPGGVETEGTHTAGIIGSDFEQQMIASTPLGRLGQPNDIAKVAVFLASDDSAWLTGERITASGGAR